MPFSIYCVLFCLLVFQSGCSSLNVPKLAENLSNSFFGDNQADDQDVSSPSEPDATLEEELAVLKQNDIWQEDKQQTQGFDNSENSAQKDLSLSTKKIVAIPEITYDLPIVHNKQVALYIELFQNRHRKYFKRWLSRSSKYLPFIKRELTKAGLPRDLAYLALIESGFNPTAYSHAHAAGLWQFIKSTGHRYGLRIDSWVDERRDPEKSTMAAIAYLSDLYSDFNDWYLAVAAYNAGEGKIQRAITKYKTNDFWSLADHRYLGLETKRYVPKLIAAILIAKNPKQYGFNDIVYEKPSQSDYIEVEPLTSLEAIALTCNSEVKTIRAINSELQKNLTPPGLDKYTLKIPPGSHDQVAARLPLVHPVVTIDYKTHEVKQGETLTTICNKYNLNKTTLLKANDLRTANLTQGKHLRIPYKTTKYVLLKEGETAKSHFASTNKDGQLFLHQIRPGETLLKIANQYGVSPEIIMQWNGLRSIHKIRAGDQLALYIDQKTDVITIAKGKNSDSRIVTLKETQKIKAKSTHLPQPAVTYYWVRTGDSLWTIAKKFRVSTLDIKKWNNLQSNLIKPGKRLVIKKG